MAFSVKTLSEEFDAMPAAERLAAGTQLLADYARHAAFNRPLDAFSYASFFEVKAGLEETALAADADVISIANANELETVLKDQTKPIILIASSARISEALLNHLLSDNLQPKTIFIAR